MNRIRQIKRAAERGVTLVEVIIVVTILALISAGAAAALFPKLKEGQVKTTRTAALGIRQTAIQWRGDHSETCPTPQKLVEDKFLDAASKLTDAWETPYKIICDEDETTVISFGPDKKEGTADDIRVPEAMTPGK